MRRARAAGPWLGREIVVEVTDVAHGGHCVGRPADDPAGRVVFVRHTLPGERVLVHVTEDRGGSFCRGEAVRVLRPAAGRVEAPCPEAGAGRCGGCDFQHADLATQRALKQRVVETALTRIAGLDPVTVPVTELPGGGVGWRSRMQFAVDGTGRPGFRRHRSHQIQPVAHCPLAVPEIAASGVLRRRWPGAGTVEVWATGGGEPTVRRAAAQRSRRAPVAFEVVSGPVRRGVTAAGRSWRLSAGAFWQVHPAAAEALVAAVRQLLAPRPGERLLDLYAGAGLFAGSLGADVGRDGEVIAVEGDPVAAGDAEDNLADLARARVRRGAVTPHLLAEVGRGVDVVVLDPPRRGAGAEVTAALCRLAPRAIAYVSCDPAALARDVRVAAEHGYRLARIRAFDAFPMTHHVECVALLEPVTATPAG